MTPAELSFLVSLLLLGGFFASSKGKSLQPYIPVRVYASLCDGVILPCGVPSPVDITADTAVEWKRTDRQSILHVVRKEVKLKKDQDPEYRGRTTIRKDGSLELQNVMLQDYGNLTCVVVNNSVKEEATVFLIQAKVSEIVFTVQRTPSNQLVVRCTSSGWSPEPHISLNTMENSASVQRGESVEEGGLFNVSVQRSISAFKGTVTLTCRVQIPGSGVVREQTIHVTDEFDSLAVCFCNSCIFLGLACLAIVTSYGVWRYWGHKKRQAALFGTDDTINNQKSAEGRPLPEAYTDDENVARAQGEAASFLPDARPAASPARRKCTEYGDVMAVTSTGASKETLKNAMLFDRDTSVSVQQLTGVGGSQELARTDYIRMKTYQDTIMSVGLELGVQPALIAAIISRQSRGGVYLRRSGFGMSDPESYGIMQINRAYHAVKGDPFSREHVDQGVTFLIQLIKTMWRTKKNWTREQQLEGALACFIAGEEKVITLEDPEGVDKVTPGGDFVNDVVARAHWFHQHGYEV